MSAKVPEGTTHRMSETLSNIKSTLRYQSDMGLTNAFKIHNLTFSGALKAPDLSKENFERMNQVITESE
jgi:hypothetical protein